MSEVIWKVDVSEEFLTFTQEPRPENFFEISEKHPYEEFGGTYCGNRRYDDVQFRLHRKLKAEYFYNSNYKDQWGNFSLRKWREAYGFPYAWSPQGFYKYKWQLYTTHINFL